MAGSAALLVVAIFALRCALATSGRGDAVVGTWVTDQGHQMYACASPKEDIIYMGFSFANNSGILQGFYRGWLVARDPNKVDFVGSIYEMTTNHIEEASEDIKFNPFPESPSWPFGHSATRTSTSVPPNNLCWMPTPGVSQKLWTAGPWYSTDCTAVKVMNADGSGTYVLSLPGNITIKGAYGGQYWPNFADVVADTWIGQAWSNSDPNTKGGEMMMLSLVNGVPTLYEFSAKSDPGSWKTTEPGYAVVYKLTKPNCVSN